MLKNASPNEIDDEEETICSMEESAREMGTLLEKKILECDRQKDDLTDLNDKFLQALSMYQQYMKEPMSAPQPVYQPTTSPQTSLQYQQPHGYVSGLYGCFLVYFPSSFYLNFMLSFGFYFPFILFSKQPIDFDTPCPAMNRWRSLRV